MQHLAIIKKKENIESIFSLEKIPQEISIKR